MKDLIFVCTGNTCRSPMAEGFAKMYMDTCHPVCSRGLSLSIGQGANPKSIVAMDMEGINIRDHVAKRFSPEEVGDKTLVLTMTASHKDYLMAYYPELKGQVFTLLQYVEVKGDVSDPYGAGQDVYNQCAKLIKKAVIKLAEQLKESH